MAKYEGIKKKIDMSKIRVWPDFELLCEIISQCLGNSPDAFLEAWISNRDEQVNQGLDTPMVAIVLEDYIREQYILHFGKNLNFKDNQINKEKCKISESPLKFFKIQLEHGREMGLVKEEDKRFPQHPRFMVEANRLKKSLEHIGIKIGSGTEHEGLLRTVDYSEYRDRDLPDKESPNKDNTLDNNNSENDNPDNKEDIFECYYCDTFVTKIQSEYETQLLKHPKALYYSNYPEIVRSGLKPQGKRWEKKSPNIVP